MSALGIAALCAGVFIVLCLAAEFIISGNLIQTTKYSVPFNCQRPVKVLQVSDLHGKRFGRGNARLLKKAAASAPDFIAVTGDIIHNYTPKNISVALQTVSALCAIAPVLYVSGNHEMRSMRYLNFKKELSKAGAVVLDNACIEICGITVAGLNGAHNKNATLKKLNCTPQSTLLLAHMPHCINNYCSAGYSLVLCGHAHGGQWRIPFTGIGLYAPGQGVFPKLTSGVHTFGDTKMIISRGLGNSQFPLRLFNRPELVEVTLTPKFAKI